MFNLKDKELGKIIEEKVRVKKTFPAKTVQLGAFEKFEHGRSSVKGTPYVKYFFVGNNTHKELQGDFNGRQYASNIFYLTEGTLRNMENMYNPIVFFGKIADQLGIREAYDAVWRECTTEVEFCEMLKGVFLDKEFLGVISGEKREGVGNDGETFTYIQSRLNYSTICRLNTPENLTYLEEYVEKKGDRLIADGTPKTSKAETSDFVDTESTTEKIDDNDDLPF